VPTLCHLRIKNWEKALKYGEFEEIEMRGRK